MNKSITLSKDSWDKLHRQLSQDNHSSVMLIREKMKVVLGFVVRKHREWIPEKGYDGYGNWEETIKLDFYDESKKTWFLIKYSDYLK